MAERRVVMSMVAGIGRTGGRRFWLGCLLLEWRALPARLVHSGASTSTEECADGCRIVPPVAAKRPFQRTKHGRTWTDLYHWMRVNKEEAVDYLHRENVYAEKCMAETSNLQRTLAMEMAGRLKREVTTPPERLGPWLYYTRVPKGKDYPIYCRKKCPEGNAATQSKWRKLTASVLGLEQQGKEEVLLDQNALVEQFGYAQLGICRLSEDHHMMAYTLSMSGNEVFTLFIKDLRTGRLLTDQTKDSVVGVEWAKDGRWLFYTEADDLLRPWRIYRRSLESKQDDTLIFEENDATCFLDVSRTKDWSFITVNINSKTSSEVYLVNGENPEGDMHLVEERRAGVQYFVEHHGGFLYILTNEKRNGGFNLAADTGDFRLVRCPLGEPSSKHWQELVSLEHGAFIEDMEIFERFLVLYQRRGGLPLVQILDLPLSSPLDRRRTLSLPKDICMVIPGANEDFHSTVLRLTVSSPNLPETVLEYNLESAKVKVLDQEEVLGVDLTIKKGDQSKLELTSRSLWEPLSDPVLVEGDQVFCDLSSQYNCQQHEVVSVDGVLVPLTVVHATKVRQDGQNPALLIGYGAYGKPLELEWCSEYLSLLDRGWVIAFAHVRGGGELGRLWHQAGQLLQKKNSFSDFIASANFLVEKNYAHRRKLGAMGVSAGGLLVASAMNQHPDLFRAVILQVPFLDINNTLIDKDLPLSVHEYDEWGDPNNPDDFDNISSYSPYDNVQEATSYPAMLVKTGLMDTRVGYWEAAKWVARARDLTNQNPHRWILLKTSMDTGHFGDAGRFSHLREIAYDYAFLIRMMDS